MRQEIAITLAAGGSCDSPATRIDLPRGDAPVLSVAGGDANWRVTDTTLQGTTTSGSAVLPTDLALGVHRVCVERAGAAAVVDLAVVPAPYTQVSLEELAVDGSARQRSVSMETVTGHPKTTDMWMTSDFIHMDRFYDGNGVAIPVVISHDARTHTFRFAAQLAGPAQPGEQLVVDQWGTAEPFSVVRTASDEFLFAFTHQPNGPAATRRIEVYRLPAGAAVLEAVDFKQRERDGRVELSRVATIPVGGTLSTRFRYKLPPDLTVGAAALGPVVATTTPALNDPDVDPAETEIRVTFDADMADGSWSWVQSDANYPKTTGNPHYIDARTCVLPVKLKPNTDYHLWINHSAYSNFRSSDGTPAVPYELKFHTGSKR